MKNYAISDIHGCFYTFKELLGKIGLNKSDKLYLLGDYINRGVHSKDVIDFIIDLQNKGYNINPLRGNHEQMIFDSIEFENWPGGESETLKSFNIKHLKELDQKYIKWFSSLKHFIKNEDFIFVHAGLNFQIANPLEDLNSMLGIRNWYDSIDKKWLNNKIIVHGHTPKKLKEIEYMLVEIQKHKVLNIDNGCFMKETNGYGHLCCIEINKMEMTIQKKY